MNNFLKFATVVVLFSPLYAFALTNSASTALDSSSVQYWSIDNANQTNLGNWGTGPFTIALWTKYSERNDYQFFVKKRANGGGAQGYSLLLDKSVPNIPELYIADGVNPAHFSTASSQLIPGVWVHISVTRDESGNIIYYINGNLAGTDFSTLDISNNSDSFAIGANPNTPDSFLSGKADDVRIWTRALSSTEVSSLYTSPCTFSNGLSLQGWWQFENNGQDSSGSNNNLTAQGSPAAGFSTDVPYTCGPVLPKATKVSISSNNASTTIARFGDKVTLGFTADKPVKTPVVTIGGRSVKPVAGKNNSYTASILVLPLDPEGPIPFSIVLTDKDGNSAPAITKSTDGTSVYHYRPFSKKLCSLSWLPKQIRVYFCS